MPNIKSAKKRVIVNQKKTEQNKNIRSEVKTAIKKIENLIKENKIAEAKSLLPETVALIDSASSKNIFHSNNASRKVANLSKKISDAEKSAPVVEEQPVAVAEEVKEETPVAEEPVKKTRKPRAKKTEEKAE